MWRCVKCGVTWHKNPKKRMKWVSISISQSDAKWLVGIIDKGTFIKLGRTKKQRGFGTLQIQTGDIKVLDKLARLFRVRVVKATGSGQYRKVIVCARRKLKEIARVTLPYLESPKQKARMQAIINAP